MLEKVWRKGNPLALLVGVYLIQLLWKSQWRFLKKLEIKPPHNPAIPLLGIYIYPEDTKIERHMFTTVLFTIARTWKQPRCLPTDKWIKKCGTYIQGTLLSHKKEHI